MPVPLEYKRASEEFLKFLVDARDMAMLATTNQAYTMVQGVFMTFRRRLDAKEAIAFAAVLPPVLRAMFVTDWDIDAPRAGFTDREDMTREVQSLRPDHNLSPDTSIRDVARALRSNVDEQALDRVLARLPAGASLFWDPT